MDEFSIDQRSAPSIGEEFEVELSAQLDEEESWESIFSGNPDHHKKLVRIAGWSYRAYGEVLSIDPVLVDCGVIQIPDVFHSHDPRVVGSFVAFTVTRLDATQYTREPNMVGNPQQLSNFTSTAPLYPGAYI